MRLRVMGCGLHGLVVRGLGSLVLGHQHLRHFPVFYTCVRSSSADYTVMVLKVPVCFYMFPGGHWYLRRSPLLAQVSTMVKSHLVVVTVQGAPGFGLDWLSVSSVITIMISWMFNIQR